MGTSSGRSGQRCIVVGVDGSEGSRAALRWAAAEARLRGVGVRAVHAWHVPYLSDAGFAEGLPIDAVVEAARATLRSVVEEELGAGCGVVQELVQGSAARALLDASRDADLVVVGTRGRGGFAGLLLGSVSHQLAHHAGCPVVIVPPPH